MIRIKSNNDKEFDKIISTNLHMYNRSKCEWIRNNTKENETTIYYNFGVYEDK